MCKMSQFKNFYFSYKYLENPTITTNTDNVLNFKFDDNMSIHSNAKANNTGWLC